MSLELFHSSNLTTKLDLSNFTDGNASAPAIKFSSSLFGPRVFANIWITIDLMSKQGALS